MAEVSELLSQIQLKEEQIQKLQSDFNKYREESKELESFLDQDIQDKQQTIEQLQFQMANSVKLPTGTVLTDDATQLQNLQEQILNLKQELKEEQNRSEELQFEIEWYKEQSTNGQSDSIKLAQETTIKDDEICNLREQLQQLQQNVIDLNVQNQELKSKEQQAINELNIVKDQHQEQITTMQAQLDTVQAQVKELQNKLEDQEFQQMEYEEDKQDNLAEITKLKQKLQDSEITAKSQKEEINKLREQLQENINQVVTNDNDTQLQNQVQDLIITNEALKMKIQIGSDYESEIKSLKLQNETMKQQIQQYCDSDFEFQIEELQAQCENYAKLNETNIEQLERLELLNKQLQEQLAQLQINSQEGNIEMSDMKQLVEQLSVEKATVADEYCQLKNKFQQQDQIIEHTQDIIKKLNNEIELLSEQKVNMEAQEDQILYLKENQSLILERNQILEQDNMELRQHLQTEQQKQQNIQTTMQNIRQRSEYQEARIEQLLNEISVLQSKECQLIEQIDEMQQNTICTLDDTNKLKHVSTELSNLKQVSLTERGNHDREIYLLNQEIHQLKSHLEDYANLNVMLQNTSKYQAPSNPIMLQIFEQFSSLQCEHLRTSNELNLQQIQCEQMLLEIQKLEQQITKLEQQLSQKELQLEQFKSQTVRKSILNNEVEESVKIRMQFESLQSKYDSLLLIKQKQEVQSERNGITNEQLRQLELENTSLKEQLQVLTVKQQCALQLPLNTPQASKRTSRLSQEGQNIQLLYIQKQHECDLKDKEIQELKQQLLESHQEQQTLQAQLCGNQGKITLKKLFSERNSGLGVGEMSQQLQLVKHESVQLEDSIKVLQGQVEQLSGQLIEKQVKLEALNGTINENLKLKKLIIQLQQNQQQSNDKQQSQTISPFSPLRVIKHLKQKSTKITVESIGITKQQLNDNEIAKKGSVSIQHFQELLNKFKGQRECLQQLYNLLAQVTVDIKIKSSVIVNEELFKKKNTLIFLDKIVVQIEYINRRINSLMNNILVRKDGLSPCRKVELNRKDVDDESCI